MYVHKYTFVKPEKINMTKKVAQLHIYYYFRFM